MTSPRLLSVRVNSEDTDAFTPVQIYYGPDKHFEREDHMDTEHTLLVQYPLRLNTGRLLT